MWETVEKRDDGIVSRVWWESGSEGSEGGAEEAASASPPPAAAPDKPVAALPPPQPEPEPPLPLPPPPPTKRGRPKVKPPPLYHRPPTAYNAFVIKTMRRLREERPDVLPRDRMRVCGEMWQRALLLDQTAAQGQGPPEPPP